MKLLRPAPDVAEAEQRLEQSRGRLREQLHRVQSAATGPSSLLVATGVGALVGSWLVRRASVSGAVGLPVRGLLLALLIRFVLRRIT